MVERGLMRFPAWGLREAAGSTQWSFAPQTRCPIRKHTPVAEGMGVRVRGQKAVLYLRFPLPLKEASLGGARSSDGYQLPFSADQAELVPNLCSPRGGRLCPALPAPREGGGLTPAEAEPGFHHSFPSGLPALGTGTRVETAPWAPVVCPCTSLWRQLGPRTLELVLARESPRVGPSPSPSREPALWSLGSGEKGGGEGQCHPENACHSVVVGVCWGGLEFGELDLVSSSINSFAQSEVCGACALFSD